MTSNFPNDKVRVVLFDFDGTLADSYAAITASVNYVRAKFGFPDLTVDQIRKLVGFGIEHLMADVVPGIDPHEAVRIYREHHPTVMFTHTHLLPDVLETVTWLKSEGFRLRICSNKPSFITKQLVEKLGINPYFQEVLGPEDCGHPKPNPAMIAEALRRFHTSTENVIYIGDMTIDIETARNAKVPVWVIASGSHDLETLRMAQPDRILEKMSDVIHLISR